ncbi:LysE family translocator [Marinovum sp.]|uniref:LysE family translocator n=1 Tax=Marinovum sp. TaxID=2024839 RepID=UPI002B27C20E|nr:LysE family translocator [Marinovum sp.]
MTLDLFSALAVFALVGAITPGPNNLMLLASGANFGLKRSLPHLLGIILGFPGMIFLVGLGALSAFERWPVQHHVLLAGSVVYMLWLAWKIANAAPPSETPTRARPLTFLQSAGFQWINPKAWTMALGAITLYAADRDLASLLWVVGAYVAAGVLSTTVWTTLGQQLRRILRSPRQLRLFNRAMALLLLASLVPALLSV